MFCNRKSRKKLLFANEFAVFNLYRFVKVYEISKNIMGFLKIVVVNWAVLY